MPVTLTTPAACEAVVGDVWVTGVDVFDDDDGELAAATVTVACTDPLGGAVSVTAESTDTTGRYVARVPLSRSGRWVVTVAASGSATGTVAAAAWAAAVTSASGMPTVADAEAYLGTDGSPHDTQVIRDALDAEAAAQRRVCTVGAVYPPDLRQALLRRVAVHLAKKGIPLAIVGVDSDAGASRLPTGDDPEVRRLERTHRKLRCG
jgi:hypothetical protein